MRLPVPERAEWQEFADRERPIIRVMAYRAMALLACVGLVLAVWASTTAPAVGAGQAPRDVGNDLGNSVLQVGNSLPSNPDS